MIIQGKVYDVLKQIALIWLPALGVFYVTLAELWNLPSAQAVSGTVLGVDTLLGAVLGISSNSYKNSDARFDGELQVVRTPEGDQNLRLKNVSYEALNTQNELTLRILDPDAPSASPPHSIASA